MARSNQLYNYTANNAAAQFMLADGTDIAIRFDDLTDEIKHQLMVHGLKQKVVDAAAIPRDVETGRSASVEDKIAAMRAVAGRLLAGEWNAVREGGGGNAGGLLLRALAEIKPNVPREELAEWLAGKDAKQKAALRASPKIAAIIERIKAAAGKSAGIDSDELLAELD